MFVICPKCASKYRIPPEISLKEGQKLQCSSCGHFFCFHAVKEEKQNESSVLAVEVPQDPVLMSDQPVDYKEKEVISTDLPEVFQPLSPMPSKSSYPWGWMILCIVVLIALVLTGWFYREKLNSDFMGTSFQTRNSLPRVSQTFQEQDQNTQEIPLLFDEVKDEKTEESLSDGQTTADVRLFGEDEAVHFGFHSIRFRVEKDEKNQKVLIEGYIQNEADYSQMLPRKIFATAYDQQGRALFQKEIYLAQEVLGAHGQKAFFGTYSPAPDGIQWIEVSCKK